MKKIFLAAALAASVCVPAYANQYSNSGDSVFDAPVYDEELVATQVVEKSAKEENQNNNYYNDINNNMENINEQNKNYNNIKRFS